VIYGLQITRQYIIETKVRRKRPDSNQKLSGEPGVIQCSQRHLKLGELHESERLRTLHVTDRYTSREGDAANLGQTPANTHAIGVNL